MTRTNGPDAVQGMIVPVITPFTRRGEVDDDSLSKQCRRMIESGINVLFMLGTTGEFYGLTHAQRRRVVQLALQAAAGEVPVVVGITGDSTLSTLNNLAAVADPQLAGYVVSTPYFKDYVQSELADYFRTIAQAVGQPIILYNFPARYRHRIDVSTVASLIQDGTTVAIKDTAGDFSYMRELIALKKMYSSFRIFESALPNLALAAPLGIDGSVQAIANLIPDQCTAMWRQVRRAQQDTLVDTVARMWAFQQRIETIATFIAALKGAMSTRTWCEPWTAAPTRACPPGSIPALRNMLSEYLAGEPAVALATREA